MRLANQKVRSSGGSEQSDSGAAKSFSALLYTMRCVYLNLAEFKNRKMNKKSSLVTRQ